MIRVAIADDHPLVRAGMRQVIRDEPTLQVVGEAADADETIALVRTVQPDVLLLDISMPGSPFPSLLRYLTTTFPALRTLVITMHAEEQFALRALREGAAGYLTKDRPPGEIVTAIRQVARGERYLTPTLGQKAAAALGGRVGLLPHEMVSPREYEVLCLLGMGRTVKQVAEQLGLSSKTVSTHRSRLLKRMGLRGTADIIRYVVQHNLAISLLMASLFVAHPSVAHRPGVGETPIPAHWGNS
jgi:two-component system, NarL family, invasion response regulator UvrY